MTKLSIMLIEYTLAIIVIVALARGCVSAIPDAIPNTASMSEKMYQESHYRAVKLLKENCND